MPENQAAPAAASILFFDGGNDGFGDFKSVCSSHSPSPLLLLDDSTPEQRQRWEEDDEWGDFLAVELGSRPYEPPITSSYPQPLFDPFPDPNPILSNSKTWVRPIGALPLSIFGDEEVEEPEPVVGSSDRLFSSQSPMPERDGIGSGPGGDLTDLITGLYGQPPVPAPAGSNGVVPDLGQGDDDLDWEFKDAFSTDTGVKKDGFFLEFSGFEKKAAVNGKGTEESTGQLKVGNVERDLRDVYVAHDGLTNGLDFGSVVVNHSHHISETNQLTNYISNGNGLQTSLENGDKNDDVNCWKFDYELSVSEDVTGSLENQNIPDSEAEVLMPNVEIQVEKDQSTAIDLSEHTILELQTLGIASEEEQQAYIFAWTQMALACAQELHRGAAIWEESIRANLCSQILSRGNRYFVALAEIYRVSEILRVTLKLYKLWLLSSPVDSSELLTNLEKCAEAWRTSGLERALESISSTADVEHEGGAKPLLESIKLIHGLDEHTLQDLALNCGKITCKLSLLPMEMLRGMKAVVWEGEHYCLKLANLWANRVSCHPPQLPRIHDR